MIITQKNINQINKKIILYKNMKKNLFQDQKIYQKILNLALCQFKTLTNYFLFNNYGNHQIQKIAGLVQDMNSDIFGFFTFGYLQLNTFGLFQFCGLKHIQ